MMYFFESLWSQVLLFVVIVVTVLYLYVSRNVNYWKSKGVNGPEPLPLFGNMLDNFYSAIPDLELQRYRQYGKVYGLYEFMTPVLTVGDPELIKEISVKNFHLFPNRLNRVPGDSFLAKMLPLLKDEEWKKVRVILTPAFTSTKMRRMFSLIFDCVGKSVTHLHKLIEEGKGDDVNVNELSTSQGFDTITKATLGVDINTHLDPDNAFKKNIDDFFNFSSWRYIVILLLPSMIKDLLDMHLVEKKVMDFFEGAVSHIVNDRKSKKIQNFDFVQHILNAEEDPKGNESSLRQGDEKRDKSQFVVERLQGENEGSFFKNFTLGDKKLTKDELFASIMSLMIAGYHTTSITLAYVIYFLAIHPEAQEKLYQELSSKFSKEEDITYEELHSLHYLDAFLCEALRYYPPGAVYDLIASTDYKVEKIGLTIPKGTRISFPAYGVHHDPENYPEPEKFKPERFLPENRADIKPCTFLPFGAGPRQCIAMNFALLEGKLYIARMVMNFKFSRTVKTAVPPVFHAKTDVTACESLFVAAEKRSR